MSFIEITAVLGNLGEFIGAIAVVVTLFYVGLQVKHSKEATEANTRSLEEGRKMALVDAYSARAFEASASFRMLADSPVAAISLKHHQSGLKSLTDEEKFRFRMVNMSNVYMLDASFCAYQQGLLPEFESTLEDNIRFLGPILRDFGVRIPRESFRPLESA
jgi:hypothetical protein